MNDIPDRPLDPDYGPDITYCSKCGAETEDVGRNFPLCADCRPRSFESDLNGTLEDITRAQSLRSLWGNEK